MIKKIMPEEKPEAEIIGCEECDRKSGRRTFKPVHKVVRFRHCEHDGLDWHIDMLRINWRGRDAMWLRFRLGISPAGNFGMTEGGHMFSYDNDSNMWIENKEDEVEYIGYDFFDAEEMR